jgi:hypothetical protein
MEPKAVRSGDGTGSFKPWPGALGYLVSAELAILRSAGFQTCCIADFQVGAVRCGQRVWKPATQQTWKSALR